MTIPEPPHEGLPNIDRPLDNTALSAYMACGREYYIAMMLHRRQAGLTPALAYGRIMHVGLEHYYRTGEPDVARMMMMARWQNHNSPDDYRSLERALLDFDKYLKRWGSDPRREDAQTIGFPEAPMVEVSTNAMGGGLIHPYAVKIDRIIELAGMDLVEDHKTTSRLDKNFFSAFQLSNQMMGYVKIAQLIAPSRRIMGVRINVIHCTKTETKFDRQLFTFTPAQLDEWTENTNEWMRRLDADVARWKADNFLRWPLAHFGTNGCDRKYGLCQYHGVCSVGPRVRQTKMEMEFEEHPWNPLEVDED